MLLFVVGMAAGMLLETGRVLQPALRAAAGFGAVVVLAWGLAFPSDALGWGWLASAGLAGALAFAAVAGGPIPRRLARASDVFGDLSYALYLLHVPFAHAWMQVFNVWLPHPGGSIGYMAGGLPLLLALSFAFHRGVERPLTYWLNARLA